MDKDSAEDVIQIQEYYDSNWVDILCDWLDKNGYEWYSINGHSKIKDEYYLVIGNSMRGVSHVCIYQNGKLYHDLTQIKLVY